MREHFSVILLMAWLLQAHAACAQDAKPLTNREGSPVRLDVVVTETSGAVVRGLQMEDFTLLDNGVPRAVTSFEAVDGQQAPVEVILVIDAVNLGGRGLAVAREEVRKFLRADQGHLDGSLGHSNRRKLEERRVGDEGHCPHSLDDQPRRRAPAGDVPTPHRIRADGQRQVPRLRLDRGVGDWPG